MINWHYLKNMNQKILTEHPDGKAGVRIDLVKYTLVKEAILAILNEREELTFSGLAKQTELVLGGGFDGSIPWYTTTVKLDLEARGMIERIPGTKPQLLRLCQSADK